MPFFFSILMMQTVFVLWLSDYNFYHDWSRLALSMVHYHSHLTSQLFLLKLNEASYIVFPHNLKCIVFSIHSHTVISGCVGECWKLLMCLTVTPQSSVRFTINLGRKLFHEWIRNRWIEKKQSPTYTYAKQNTIQSHSLSVRTWKCL